MSECSDEAIQQLWSFVPGYSVSGIALHGGTVFLVADGIARALDAATGQERWRVAEMDASASATPVLVGGGAIEIGGVMHEDFENIRLDANDGAVIGPAEHRFSGDELEGEQERQLPEGYSIEAGALSYRGTELLELEDELISVGRVGSLSIVSYSYEEVVAVDDGGTVVWRCALGQPLVDPDAYPVLVEGDIAVVTGADWTVRGLRVTAADAP